MCENRARYRYTWPGKDESLICEEHVGKLRTVANAIGLYLQIVPLSMEDMQMGFTCLQKEG